MSNNNNNNNTNNNSMNNNYNNNNNNNNNKYFNVNMIGKWKLSVTTQNVSSVAPTFILLCERTNQSKPQHFKHNELNTLRKT